MKKILFIATGLALGGAEISLEKLVIGLAADFEVTVISLTENGIIGDNLKKKNITVKYFPLKYNISGFFSMLKLFRFIRQLQPDIIQTWMYHADFVGLISKLFYSKAKIVWGIRNLELASGRSNKATIAIRKICASLSSKVDKIICCAYSVQKYHQNLGYAPDKLITIVNGIKLNTSETNYNKQNFIAEIDNDKFLIGCFGRYHPDKDYKNLIQALANVAEHHPGFICFLCGKDMNTDNEELVNLINKNKLTDKIKLLGIRIDLHNVYPLLDLYVSSSATEAFPNVVAEAMSFKIPCVVTDVGDAANIVAETGWVVPKCNPQALADKIMYALNLTKQERINFGQMAHLRIVNVFSEEQFITSYKQVYMKLLNQRNDICAA